MIAARHCIARAARRAPRAPAAQACACVRVQQMFSDARAFNQPIGDWDVSSVLNFEKVFDSAQAFNQPLYWNPRSATYRYAVSRLPPPPAESQPPAGGRAHRRSAARAVYL